MELDLESFLKQLGVGQRPIDDLFYENTYKNCKVFERKGVTVEDDEALCHEIMKAFRCNACDRTFQNLVDYELHYNDYHHYYCAECKKVRPTSRLLEIHIQEAHDSFFKVLSERQPMYQCFVSECDLKFSDAVERRQHCRDVHAFPKNYRFDDLNHGKPEKKSETPTPMEVGEVESQPKRKEVKVYLANTAKQKTFSKRSCLKVPDTSNNNSSTTETQVAPVTRFIPRQVKQNSYARSLTNNKQMETNVLETKCMMELGESLPDI